ncbi:MAG: serine/threonine-protein kinase, partial [Myxococcota bacterium]
MLNHPNIVQVFDLAREGNEYYIAMEYVPGTNVGQMLELCHKRRLFLPTEVAVFITMQVLRGLAYAHDLKGLDGEPMNILHRDVTPQNILVTPSAWVKITDFGIAKARNEISTTSPGMIKGKLGYIAPEQLNGNNPTQSVDIFCAGILLWESLATRRLFKGTDEIDTFRLISKCEIPSMREFRDDVSPELEKVLNTALAATPEERYPSADAFYNALNQTIFPRTADDFAAAAKKYFGEHPEFFEKVVTPDALGLDDGRTIEIDTPSVLTEDLPNISDVLPPPEGERPPPSPARGTPWFAVLALLLLALGGIGTWMYYGPDTRSEAAPRGPEKLTAEEIQLGVDAEKGRLLECYLKGNRTFFDLDTLNAKIVVASTGGVAEATLDAPEGVNEAV